MRGFLVKNKIFLILCFIWILLLTPLIILVPKGTSHLFINKYHLSETDIFFKYFTNLGDGLVPVLIAFVLVFFSYRKSLLILASGSIAGILAQLIKRFIDLSNFRPIKFFESSTLHLVPGVKMFTDFSFPSGHSATIFALCFSLASIITSKFWKIVLFCTAVLVAYSRVYLSQHFLVDIYAGSIIGILSATIVIIFLDKQNNNWLDSSFTKTIIMKRK